MALEASYVASSRAAGPALRPLSNRTSLSVRKNFLFMKQLYNDYTHELAYQAVANCFDRKWNRRDILTFIEEYAGISRYEIYKDMLNNSVWTKLEAIDAIAYFVDEMISGILEDREPEDVFPVTITERPDGMTNKIREIANLSIPHQLLGHVVKLGIEPLLKARLLPQQHASIPGRGQTKLKGQIGAYLRMRFLNIQYAVKTDIVHAYSTLMYADVINFFEKEIPSANWILKTMHYLESIAPDGHLIIGGYLDAWLFNYIMSYAIKAVFMQGSYRRNNFYPYISRIATYMDDFCFMARTRTGIRRAVQALNIWLYRNLHMKIKQTSNIIDFYSIFEERKAKYMSFPSQRGCPGIDMGGYKIHRTYMTMRPRVVKRVIRAFSRAWKEMQATGTIQKQRVQSLISRYSHIKQTTSKYFKDKYHIDEIMKMAKRICAFWNRRRAIKKKEWLKHAVARYQIWLNTAQSYFGSSSGRAKSSIIF